MSVEAFVDTNILIYAHDKDAGDKHRVASELIGQLWENTSTVAISIQVLQEFYVNALKRGIPDSEISAAIRDYLQWQIISSDPPLLLDGIFLRHKWQVSFWDALIIAAGKRAGARVIYSEDLSHRQDYGGVVVINPFKEPVA